MASLKSRYWKFLLWLMGKKRNRRTLEAFLKDVKKQREIRTSTPPEKLRKHFDIRQTVEDGFPVYSVTPKGITPGQFIFYLHGGAYVGEIVPPHWEFVAHLAARIHARVIVPIYPLAPEHTVETMLPFAQTCYEALEASIDGQKIHVVGDSAGAGMALAMVQQQISLRGASSAHQLILVSPWLDVTMQHPDIPELDKKDPWLTAVSLAEAGRWYAGEAGTDDPRVSPINGELAGLPPCHLFIGTHDILLPDSQVFAKRLADAGMKHSLHVYDDMFHCWVMADMPETRHAREQIIGLLQS